MNQSVSRLLNAFFSSKGSDIALLVLRLFVGVMMLTHGMTKIENFSTLKETFPDPIGWGSYLSLLLITCTEVGGSLLLILGLLTRLAAIPLIFGMCVAAFLTAPEFSLATSELPMMYLGIYVTILLAGPGEFSLDELLRMVLQKCSRNNGCQTQP